MSKGPPRFDALLLVTVFLLFATSVRSLGQLAWDNIILSTNVSESTRLVHFAFSFTNLCPVPIKVTEAYSDCGCTAVDIPSSAVIPAKVGRIVVTIDVEHETGRIQKAVRVGTDTAGTTTLFSIVEIQEIVTVSSRSLEFNRTNLVEQTITFSNLLAGPIRIRSLVCDSKNPIQSAIQEPEPGRKFIISFKPAMSKESYEADFNVIFQQRDTHVEKNCRFKIKVK